ncbi:MAG: hypothetical protein LC640_09380 [Frankia sp.]|nr:hypothetical protein [Frankia sp.]
MSRRQRAALKRFARVLAAAALPVAASTVQAWEFQPRVVTVALVTAVCAGLEKAYRLTPATLPEVSE